MNYLKIIRNIKLIHPLNVFLFFKQCPTGTVKDTVYQSPRPFRTQQAGGLLGSEETRAPQVGAKDTIYRSYNLASEHFLLL